MSIAEDIFKEAGNHVDRLWLFVIASSSLALVLLLFGRKPAQCFALMTLVWVVINAWITFWLQQHIHLPEATRVEWTYRHVSGMMYINVLLDVVYLLCGAYLTGWGTRSPEHKVMLSAFGKAVYVQGGGLLLLDAYFLLSILLIRH